MFDFTSALGQEIARERQQARDRFVRERRWHRELRHADEAPRRRGGFVRLFESASTLRHREFVTALDAAQREGITIDAWFGFKFADPDLSARAEWAGLNDTVEIQGRRGARNAA